MKYKKIMELIFIFIIPLLLLIPGLNINNNYEYDNQGNFELSSLEIEYNNKLLIDNDGYVNKIANFNLFNEQWNDNTALNSNGTEYSINGYSTTKLIEINDNTIYIKIDASNSDLSACIIVYYDNTNTIIDYGQIQVNQNWANTTITTPSGTKYIKFYVPTAYKENINVNYSITWANGNYVPYGKPLIIYSQNDISGQNDINYTPIGQIKELIESNLYVNDNIITDILFDYTLIWFIMFILWHFFYLFFDMLVHLFIDWGHKEREKLE